MLGKRIRRIIVIYILFTISLSAQVGYETEQKNMLLLNSDIVGAKVIINDEYKGETPLELHDFPTGMYDIKFIIDTMEVKKTGVEYKNGSFREICGVFEKGIGLLSVYSNPKGAHVSINDSIIGVTPLNKFKIKEGVYNLKVSKSDHDSWTKRIIVHRNLYQYDANLKANIGFLSIFKKESDVITLNGKPHNNSGEIKIPIGEYKLEIDNIRYHKKFSTEFIVNPLDNYNISFKYGTKSYSSLLNTFIFPGYGQFNDNYKTKGKILMGGGVMLWGLSIYGILDFNSKNEDYSKFKTSYDIEKNEFEVLRLKEKMKSAYDDAESAKKIRNYSLGALALYYVYNLVDCYINHTIGGEFELDLIKNENLTKLNMRVGL